MKALSAAVLATLFVCCVPRVEAVDAGESFDASVVFDAGDVDAGEIDAGEVDAGEPLVCTSTLHTDAGSYCVTITDLHETLTAEFSSDRVFLSNRHGDWSVLAQTSSRHFTSGRLRADGSFEWLRRDVPAASDSDEFGNLCGASDRTNAISPAYWPVDGGDATHFPVNGGCIAVRDGRMLVSGLGLVLVNTDGTPPVRVTPTGEPVNGRFVGWSSGGRALANSWMLRGDAHFNVVDIVSADGGVVGQLSDLGLAGGAMAKASSISGAAVGHGLISVVSSIPLLWRDPLEEPIQLGEPDVTRFEFTHVSTTYDACALSSGGPVFWVPPNYEPLQLTTLVLGDACVGAMPGGRFLISRVSNVGEVGALLVRIVALP